MDYLEAIEQLKLLNKEREKLYGLNVATCRIVPTANNVLNEIAEEIEEEIKEAEKDIGLSSPARSYYMIGLNRALTIIKEHRGER